MDVLIYVGQDAHAIRCLQRRRAVQVDASRDLWGLRDVGPSEVLDDLTENAPSAEGWIAEVSDFKNIG
jgi:hypothetical protein